MSIQGTSSDDRLIRTPDIGDLARPRVVDLLNHAIDHHRVTLVTAPAGFGKTVALRSWARQSARSVIWVDARPGANAFDQLPQLSGNPAALLIDGIDRPPDDSELIILEDLLGEGSEGLRIVVSGRTPTPFPLARLALSEGIGFVGAADLAFTGDEVAALGPASGTAFPSDWAAALIESTEGWPVAVRLGIDEALRARSANGNAAGRYQVSLNEYVAEAMLDAIPDRLSDFVLRATAHDTIDPALATVLWGDAGGASLLSDCVAFGLPLDRADTDSPTWRWNPAFAAQTRRILAARDPQLAVESAVLAANGLRSTAPAAAADLALRGKDPHLAFEIILEHWILWLLENRAERLEGLCRRLPLPWSERPDTLLIRACCSQRSRQEEEATRLRARVQRRSQLLGQSERDRFDVLHTYAELLLATGDDALDRASKRAVLILDQQSNERPALHASVLFLAGFAEMRLRRDGKLAVSLLRDAASIYLANGMEALGHRATAYAAFVHAYHGEFNDAVRTVAPGTAVAAFGGKEINGAIWLARGWVAYWRNDLDAAESSLRLAAEALDEPPAGPSTALQFLVLTAAARGHSADLSRAIEDLNRIAPDGAYGIPWKAIRRTVAALIAERRGDLAGARELARTASTGEHAPINAVLLAALHRRLGDHASARRCLADAEVAVMPYVRAHAAVVEALLSLDEGRRDEAHLALERALDCAAPEGVRRCFAENDADLRPLLEEHSIWGTSHEALVLDLLHDSGSPPVDFGLSPRELEILRFMRTRMTAAEMAEALYISIATVKTHQRSIYRKLGVRNRREALIAALSNGLI